MNAVTAVVALALLAQCGSGARVLASGATRDLPPTNHRHAYAVKAGLTYRVF